MSRFTWWIRVLPFTVGILTGCTTLVTTYDRVRAALEPEPDETIHTGGAWFLTPSKGHPRLGCIKARRPARQKQGDFVRVISTPLGVVWILDGG